LNNEIQNAKNKQKGTAKGTTAQCGSTAAIKDLLGKIPGMAFLGSNSDLERDMDNIDRKKGSGGKNPNEMNPQELRNAIWPILVFRDNRASIIQE